ELNGLVAGVTATARTVVKLSLTGTPTANYGFKLTVGGVTATFANIGDQKELFRQLNEQASTLNIAVDEEAGTITSTSGENIVVGAAADFTGTGGTFEFT